MKAWCLTLTYGPIWMYQFLVIYTTHWELLRLVIVKVGVELLDQGFKSYTVYFILKRRHTSATSSWNKPQGSHWVTMAIYPIRMYQQCLHCVKLLLIGVINPYDTSVLQTVCFCNWYEKNAIKVRLENRMNYKYWYHTLGNNL